MFGTGMHRDPLLSSRGFTVVRWGQRRIGLKLYESTEYKVRLAEQKGFLFNAPNRPVKVVAIEHQRGGRGREVFYSTETSAEAEQILQWFSWRGRSRSLSMIASNI